MGDSWFSPLCSPGRWSASRSTFSALPPVSRLFWACTLLLRVRLRPLPDDSLSALWLPVHLLWCSMRLRVCEGSSLSAWSFPYRGLSPFSRLFLTWRPGRSRSLFPSLAPSWWWPCPLRRCVLLSLSGYGLSVPLAVFFASVLLIDPVALSPLLHRVFADGFRHWCVFRLCGGASPHAFGSVWTLGELRWLHLYRLTPTWLVSADLPCDFGAQVGVSYFSVRHSAHLHGDHFVSFPDSCVSMPHLYLGCSSLDSCLDEWLGGLSVTLLSLPGFCHLRGLIVPTV